MERHRIYRFIFTQVLQRAFREPGGHLVQVVQELFPLSTGRPSSYDRHMMLQIVTLLAQHDRSLGKELIPLFLCSDLFFHERHLKPQLTVLHRKAKGIPDKIPAQDRDHELEHQDAELEKEGSLHIPMEEIVIRHLQKCEQCQYRHRKKETPRHRIMVAQAFLQDTSPAQAKRQRAQDMEKIHGPCQGGRPCKLEDQGGADGKLQDMAHGGQEALLVGAEQDHAEPGYGDPHCKEPAKCHPI